MSTCIESILFQEKLCRFLGKRKNKSAATRCFTFGNLIGADGDDGAAWGMRWRCSPSNIRISKLCKSMLAARHGFYSRNRLTDSF